MGEDVVAINPAPVLTLWASVVAERAGHDWPAALRLGNADACGPADLPAPAYRLYERFGPQVERGRAGWGHKGALDLGGARAFSVSLREQT